jgi:hypothetical protein
MSGRLLRDVLMPAPARVVNPRLPGQAPHMAASVNATVLFSGYPFAAQYDITFATAFFWAAGQFGFAANPHTSICTTRFRFVSTPPGGFSRAVAASGSGRYCLICPDVPTRKCGQALLLFEDPVHRGEVEALGGVQHPAFRPDRRRADTRDRVVGDTGHPWPGFALRGEALDRPGRLGDSGLGGRELLLERGEPSGAGCESCPRTV